MPLKMDQHDIGFSVNLENTLVDHLRGATIGPIKFDNKKHTIRVAGPNGSIYKITIEKIRN